MARGAEAAVSAEDRLRRTAPAGLWRHRADSGTDTTSLKTFARREGRRYIVNGQKIWTSRAEHSDLMLLLARTTPGEQAKKRTEASRSSSSTCGGAKARACDPARSAP